MYKKKKRRRSIKSKLHRRKVFRIHKDLMKQLITFYFINLRYRLFCYAIQIHSVELAMRRRSRNNDLLLIPLG